MVRGAPARPRAGSPGSSARRTTGGPDCSSAGAASPPAALAKAAASTSSAAAAGVLMPLFLGLLVPLVWRRVVGLADRLRRRDARLPEGARSRRARDRRAPLVARRILRGLGARI